MTAIPLETLVTVFGGSGFLGRHVVRALAKRGYRVRVAVRRPELAGHLQPLGWVGQIHAVQANLRYPASVEAAARDADVVINLVGILFERGPAKIRRGAGLRRRGGGARGRGLWRAHDPRLGNRRRRTGVLALCALEGRRRESWCLPPCPPRSSCGPRSCSAPKTTSSTSSPPSRAFRRRCRWSAAAIPGSSRCSRETSQGRSSPRSKIAPRTAQIYELGGPEVRSFKELMQFVLTTIERRRLLVPIPFGLAKLQASLLQLMPKPLLTTDQVELLRNDSIVSDAGQARRAHARSAGRRPRHHGRNRAVLSVALPQDRPVPGTGDHQSVIRFELRTPKTDLRRCHVHRDQYRGSAADRAAKDSARDLRLRGARLLRRDHAQCQPR